MNRWWMALERRPRLVLGVMLAASFFAIAGITRLKFDGSVHSLTVEDDPARLLHTKTKEIFGDQEIGVVALLVDDAYTPEALEALRGLTDRIGPIDGVARALSLTSASDPDADVIAPPPLLPRGPVTEASARHVRERVKANKLYVPHLVARDGRASAVNVFFERRGEPDEDRIDRQITQILDEYTGPGEVHYTGMSHIRVRATDLMRRDLANFLPVSLAAMMVVLWLAFGSVRAVVLPLVSVAIGTGILLGIMGWAGEPITLATLVLPSLLIVIGSSYAIHVTAAALEAAPGESLATTIRRVGLPVLTSASTNAVGFGSLAFHRIPAISGLGLYAVIGTLIVGFGSLFGLLLAFRAFLGRMHSREQPDGAPAEDRIERIVVGLADAAVRHRRVVFAVAAVLAIAGFVGARRIEVSTDLLSAFRKDSDVRRSYDLIAERLAGPNPVSIVITAPEPGYFRSIVSLRRLKEFQEFLEGAETVDATLSLVDYLDEIDVGLQSAGGDFEVDEHGELVERPAPKSFWDAPKDQLPEIFRLVETSPQTFSGVVDKHFQRVRVTARTAIAGSRETKQLVDDIENYAETFFPRGIQTQVTGNLVVISSVSDIVLSGQIESIAFAYGAIFLVLVLLFLSFRVGAAAMVPNVLPNLVFFGVMGWSGIPLNLATSIIGAVALGIGVDDTIHYMSRLNQVVKTTPSHREALRTVMRMVGRPVVATSITLTVGFLVMVMSNFALISAFGWLSAMTITVAMAANILLLPAVLATVPIVSVWDLVAFRLGPSPQTTIPLFQGLGGLSTRLVVLLGTLRSFAPEQYVMHRGDPGNEMYLVLSGKAEVRAGDKMLAKLERGDVVGEMGLLRHTVRTADVLAKSELEVLVIDEDFLRRLQARYPRFASRIFLNVARILSDRLEQANRRVTAVD